jgi:hypothetical protein
MKEAEKKPYYPAEFSSHLSEPLITSSGDATGITLSEQSFERKITELTTKIYNISRNATEFSAFHDVDFGNAVDSLGLSLFFKKACNSNGMLCRLVIGKKDDKYYAWAQVFTEKWVNVDVAKGLVQKPAYDVVYVEPTVEFHLFEGDELKQVYRGMLWFGRGADILPFVLILVVFAGILIWLQLKYDILAKTPLPKKIPFKIPFRKAEAAPPAAPMPPGAQIPPEAPSQPQAPGQPPQPQIPVQPPAQLIVKRTFLSGKYVLLNENVTDPLAKEVLKYMKTKQGIVSVEEYAGALGLSKELIEYGLQFLIKQGHVKKEN